MNYLAYVFILFMIYSIIGYICEMTYAAFKNQKIVNRGFLCGPYLPIFGLGSIFILYALTRYENDPIVVFVFGMIICSALEYFTSFLLEKIFHNMWWDYYEFKYNLNGRICLFASILFGVGGLLIIYVVQPLVERFLDLFTARTLNISALVLLIIFIIDVIYSIVIAYNLRNRLILAEQLKKEKITKISKMLEEAVKEKIGKLILYPKRLLKAFPKLKMDNLAEFDFMKKYRRDKKKTKKSKK